METDPKAFRTAATVLLAREDPFEVLMVRRHAKATFASRLVFPGGVVDPGDSDEEWMSLVTGADDLTVQERSLRICAIRETWEETGILIGTGFAPVAADDIPFRSVIETSGQVLALDAIHPFSHWITPELEVRRFDTHFYLAAAPAGQIPVADGGETVEFRWLSVDDRSDPGLMFPTIMNLNRLAESAGLAAAIEASRVRTPYTVQPVMTERPDGSRMVSIPVEAGYGVTEFVHT